VWLARQKTVVWSWWRNSLWGKSEVYKLYARKNTGSAAVEALLAVLGVEHELIDVPKDDAGEAPEWYAAINARREVPTLGLPDGSVMTESAAMMMHLADAHPEAGLSPAVGTAARAQYLRWMVYMAAAPYASDLRMYYPERYSTDAGHADAIKQKAIIDLARDFDVFARDMGQGPFILGPQISAADIYAAMLLTWSNDVDALFAEQPKLWRLYEGVAANAVVRRVWDRNGMM
jgi:glutathione S-transferase